jgi:hypothetical protein
MCIYIIVQILFCSFRKQSPSQWADVISLDYIVDGQLLTELHEDETVSLNFSQNIKTAGNRVRMQNIKGKSIYICNYYLFYEIKFS